MKIDEAQKRFPWVVDLAGAEPVHVTDNQGRRTVAVVMSAKQFDRLSARPDHLEWAKHEQAARHSAARQVIQQDAVKWASKHLETLSKPADDSVAGRRLAVKLAELLRSLGLTQVQACSAVGRAMGVSHLTVAEWARRAEKGWNFKQRLERRRPGSMPLSRLPWRVPAVVRAIAVGRVVRLGEPVASVARDYRVEPPSVRRWVEKAHEAILDGTCEVCAQRDKDRPGRPRKPPVEHPDLFEDAGD